MNDYVSVLEEKIAKQGDKDNKSYIKQFRQQRKNGQCLLPSTVVRSFPRNENEWLYGFTYRGTGIINIREDLSDKQRTETEIHESLHTSDEYETRRLTEWMMMALFPEREKYNTKPQEYIH